MLSPKLYKNGHAYDLFMRVFGFEASVERFLSRLPITVPEGGKILDTGCGSGTLGIHFLQSGNRTSLLSTDLEPNFIDAAKKKASRRGIRADRMNVGIADISRPDLITTIDQQAITLEKESFSLICIGAVLGYAKSPESSLQCLVELLQPGGYLLNLEMCETALGEYVCGRYHYHNISLERMSQILREDCEVTSHSMNWQHFPACMTRTAVIAKKNAPSR